jgi:hypothetical protein
MHNFNVQYPLLNYFSSIPVLKILKGQRFAHFYIKLSVESYQLAV